MRNQNLKRYVYASLAAFGAIALSILFFFFMFRAAGFMLGVNKFLSILMPFIYGAVIAYLLCPICNFFEGKIYNVLIKKVKKERAFNIARALSILISFVLAFFIIYILLLMVIPQIAASVMGIAEQVPDSINKSVSWTENILADNEMLLNYTQQISEKFTTSFDDWIKTALLPNMQTIVSGFSTGVVNVLILFKNLLIGIVVAVYLLMSRTRFLRQAKMILYSIFNNKWANIIYEELSFVDKMFSGFINGKIIDSLIIGVICFCGMQLFDMPYAMLVSVIVGITNVIPFFGPYIGAVPSALLILMVSPIQCLYFIVFIFVLQQFDGNILGPKILGNSTGLSSFWVLFSILLFGGLYGFVGMIIGVPVFAVIYDIVRKLVTKGLYRRGESKLLEEYDREFPSK